MAYATSNNELASLAAGVDSPTVTDALEAGAHEIDSAFGSAGYTVPINLAVITPAESQTRMTAFLKILNLDLAACLLTSLAAGNRGRTERVKLACDEAKQKLADIRAGILKFPFLPSADVGAVLVVGDEEWPDTRLLYDIEDATRAWG